MLTKKFVLLRKILIKDVNQSKSQFSQESDNNDTQIVQPDLNANRKNLRSNCLKNIYYS